VRARDAASSGEGREGGKGRSADGSRCATESIDAGGGAE